ncbi:MULTISPECIES: hypothetical protein [unclassified Marinovum]
MTGTETSREDMFLDTLFDEARQTRAAEVPEVSPDLMARILADAENVQAGFDTAALPVRRAPPRPGLWAQIGAALGGWPAFAGLAATSICGVWLGISPPDGLSDTASLYYSSDTALYDPVSGFEFDLEES